MSHRRSSRVVHNDREARSFSSATADAPRHTTVDQAALKVLSPQISSLIEHIEPSPVREMMSSIFTDLARLLEYLSLIEDELRQDGSLQEILTVFTLVHIEARALLDFIDNRAIRAAGIGETLYDVLDGTSYAIKHELCRVFESESIELSATKSSHLAYSQIMHTHGLLSNCFQQSTITLAQVFDSRVNGASLFNDFQIRLEQSIALCEDLWALIRLVRRAEKECDRPTINALIERLNFVRYGSMHYLMYRDWEEFERLVEEIMAAHSVEELVPVLHRFARYLETLLGQVRMRAVLNNHCFDFSGTDL